jgi:virulence factor Mce-like protein
MSPARRRRNVSVAANGVLIGAVTTLVVVVAVFLAYNANSGLPFVPTYSVNVIVEDAAELVPGNEVRVGGTRVGVITGIVAQKHGSGFVAKLALKLDKSLQPLAADSQVTVRQRSNLGLKYLQVEPGDGARKIQSGGTLPLTQATSVVSLDDALNAFDLPTRQGIQGVTQELGGGLAGRGADLNRTIEELPPLLGRTSDVMRNLASPETDLVGFLQGARSAMTTLSPVAGALGDLLAAASTTFDAIDGERGALDRTLALAPRAEAAGVVALPRIRPLLRTAGTLLDDTRPAAAKLPAAARALTTSLRVSGQVLNRARSSLDRLAPTFAQLGRTAKDPAVSGALRTLTRTSASAVPLLTYFNPMQTRCNYLGAWGRNVTSTISEGDAMGTWFRFTAILRAPEMLQAARPAPELHVNPVPDSGQNGECEPGNTAFTPGKRVFGAPGVQRGSTVDTAPGTTGEMVQREAAGR